MNATVTIGDRRKFKTELYADESIFLDIKKIDGTAYDATTTASWTLVDNQKNVVDTGEILKSLDLTIFEMRFYQSSTIKSGKIYELRARLQDSATHYNDVVATVEITAQ